MLSRRSAIMAAGAALLVPGFGVGPARSAQPAAKIPPPELTDDGLYRQQWFLDSFLEIADDIDTAHQNGRRLAIMWELKGCPYCRETHFVNFADPVINQYVRENFDVLQLNIIGSRLVTDIDGEQMSEKKLAAKYGVRFTPTFQFFPETADGLAELAPSAREIARAPGYLMPRHFLAFFRFIREKAYESKSFRTYLRANST
ncbi:MAG: thioredoxin family protein [Alphaproteobacteria bacterium]